MHTSDSKPKPIFRRLRRKGFSPTHVCEVGVWLPQTCNVLDFARAGIRTTLVEANPRIVAHIETYFAGHDNVTVHPVAVFDRACELELYDRGPSTFAGDVAQSPAAVNDDYRADDADSFTVDAVTFDAIDDGRIDLLSVDIEGCEWFVIRHMRSRPAVISLETHGARYVNPHLDDILDWMQANRYAPWYRDRTDTVFVRRIAFPIGPGNRLALAWRTLRLAFRRIRKSLFR